MIHLTLIHGFTQDSSVWNGVITHLPSAWETEAIDLPGHGRQGILRPVSPQDFLARTERLLSERSEAAKRIICGYSMGGRVALQLALRCPDRWTDVAVVSSGIGISDQTARAERARSDEALANQLETGSIDEFAERWDALPLWESDPDQVRNERRAMVLHQDPTGLAAALRAFGQGTAPAFEGFGNATEPGLTVVRGKRDTAYEDATENLAMLGATAPVVIPGGHSLPLESPDALAGVISSI